MLVDLLNTKCKNTTNLDKISGEQINYYLSLLNSDWKVIDNSNHASQIQRRFEFKNFKQTIFFMNAIAFICEQECHHPDIKLGYNYCEVNLSTHDIGSISINDFICAAKIDKLADS